MQGRGMSRHIMLIYTETKKFSNTSQIGIFITDIRVEFNTNLLRFFCSKCEYNLIQYQIL